MNKARRSTSTDEEPQCGKPIVVIFFRHAKRKLVSLESRANQLRSSAIREAAHIAGTDVGLEQGIIEACFRRQLHYDLAYEYQTTSRGHRGDNMATFEARRDRNSRNADWCDEVRGNGQSLRQRGG